MTNQSEGPAVEKAIEPCKELPPEVWVCADRDALYIGQRGGTEEEARNLMCHGDVIACYVPASSLEAAELLRVYVPYLPTRGRSLHARLVAAWHDRDQSPTPAEAPKLPTTRLYGGKAMAVEGAVCTCLAPSGSPHSGACALTLSCQSCGSLRHLTEEHSEQDPEVFTRKFTSEGAEEPAPVAEAAESGKDSVPVLDSTRSPFDTEVENKSFLGGYCRVQVDKNGDVCGRKKPCNKHPFGEPAPVAEAEGRVTHEFARNAVGLAMRSGGQMLLHRYIDQQEQSEREALDLRKELARLRTGQATLTQNAATAAGERDELKAKLSEAERRLGEQNVCWHCKDVLIPDQRPHCESCPADGDCDDAACSEDGCREERAQEPTGGEPAKPAQQAGQKPAQAEQGWVTATHETVLVDGEPNHIDTSGTNPAGERGDFRVGQRVTWRKADGGFVLDCRIKSLTLVTAQVVPWPTTGEQWEYTAALGNLTPVADPAQPQLQGEPSWADFVRDCVNSAIGEPHDPATDALIDAVLSMRTAIMQLEKRKP